ncbi:3-keto-5-aminohexanoate cleavage protein [Thalassospira alkalitolerans]|uniref:3-keto-5-aminohexanoate cleavage protein n=1 Tax=Thalassospira alkalitolerans TaxID=1293890 RepID=A0A1Y2LG22_9PROT|nr:3-keto-5-aminohexanoate cleavage protein [Thalassospira alkalitolerans]OSQ48838.1 3-keto-5-aminohexanoate cleavage protein [Thalassospira alkalitolerans]
MSRKVIITCAITGSVHTPSMSPHLPITPDQIADQAIAAAEAGAAILHLHARDPETGFPSPEPDLFNQFLPRIKSSTDAVINISTGGGMTMTVKDRIRAAQQAAPEMASLNMGTMNFGLFPALAGRNDWKHDWEPKFLEDSRDFVFKNTFADIETILADLGVANGTRFEFECYDVGHLYTLAHFVDRGLIKGPIFIQFVLGVLGGIGADSDNLAHLKRTADKLFGNQYEFSVLGAGRHQMPLATMSAAMGGHVRVGLEDNLYLRKGELAPDNASQVRKIREVLDGLSLEIATPDDARSLLNLKGADQVAF